jgi:hypothetical protein
MRTVKAISFVCLCLLTGGFIASGAPASKSATPLTFANAVAFFKAASDEEVRDLLAQAARHHPVEA